MKQFGKYWTNVLVRGVIAVIFGLIALTNPLLGLEIFVLFFGAYALIDGVIAVTLGLDTKSGLFIFEGILGVLVGLYVFFFTAQAIVIFILMVGIWALATGILEIAGGLALRKHITNEIFLVALGVVSALFGIYVLVQPALVTAIIAIVIGAYALMFGILLILLAFKLKSYVPKKSASKKKRKK